MMLFISSSCLAQNADFNKNEYKFYSISISNLKNQEQANSISELSEKNLLSEFSWVDFSTNTGFFLLNNASKISEIEKIINSNYGLSVFETKEINFDNELFLKIYYQKGNGKSEYSINQPPDYIHFGIGNESKSEKFYQMAKKIWINKYPESYNALYNNNEEQSFKSSKNENKYYELPSDFPKFIDTGNPQSDITDYQKTKDDWILKNPDKYKTIINFGKINDSENQEKISKEQKINKNK